MSYEEWLERYKAWDKLDKVYGEERTPENILTQAQNALNAGNPVRVLEIVEGVAPFEDDNATEAQRLWLGGQAYRALGQPERAVAWFSQASPLFQAQKRTERFSDEPALAALWRDVFRKLFLQFNYNVGMTREAQQVFLQNMIGQASEVWPSDKFWSSANTALEDAAQFQAVGDVENGVEGQDDSNATTSGELPQISSDSPFSFGSDSDRMALSMALAASALGRPGSVFLSIADADNDFLAFWSALGCLIENDDTSGACALDQLHLKSFRSRAFVEDGRLVPLATRLREAWALMPADGAEADFSRNVRLLDGKQLHDLFVEDRQASLMIEPVPADRLAVWELGAALAAGDKDAASEALAGVEDPGSLPFGLYLSTLMALDVAPESLASSGQPSGISQDDWRILMEAAGASPRAAFRLPFWQVVDPATDRDTLIRRWPLDPDVMLEIWKHDWQVSPEPELARRLAYLYGDSPYGDLASIYLAGRALEEKQLPLSRYYLNQVHLDDANATITAKYYEADAELHIANEDMEAAYQSYQQLVATGVPIDDMTRLKIAFLLQQRGQLSEGREHLLRLWERKDEFDTAMQAELLFYLAEGEQAMGNSDLALDYYLQLAWKYPQESMWALTAMYRAATIYETAGQFEPAARLLQTVVKNAQTPKQKEAAQQRLDDIEARRAERPEIGAGSVPYPF
jgi:hypothetical protein